MAIIRHACFMESFVRDTKCLANDNSLPQEITCFFSNILPILMALDEFHKLHRFGYLRNNPGKFTRFAPGNGINEFDFNLYIVAYGQA
jgi:hypothetical protein